MDEKHLHMLATHPLMRLCFEEILARYQCARYILILEQCTLESLPLSAGIDRYQTETDWSWIPADLLL